MCPGANVKGERFQDNMPATNARLRLPYNKLWTNLVLMLYMPLHQLKPAQLDLASSNIDFYLNAMYHRWDSNQLPANTFKKKRKEYIIN
jgi:hypothetical protein